MRLLPIRPLPPTTPVTVWQPCAAWRVTPPAGASAIDVVRPPKSLVPIDAAPVSPVSKVRRVDGVAADASVDNATCPEKANDKIVREVKNFFPILIFIVRTFIVSTFHEG